MPDLINGLGGSAGFGENAINVTDDGSSSSIDLSSLFPSGFSFFGNTFSSVYINNNGNITFGSSLSDFTPFGISSSSIPIIAPFFADVDTGGGAGDPTSGGTSTGANRVWYDLDATSGAFTVTWDDVGYFNRNISKLNAFQVQLVHVGDASSTDFDLTFVYESINWTTGDFSGGSNGLGGTPARLGIAGGNGLYYEFEQSGDQDALLGLPSTVGQYTFHFRAGGSGGDTVTGTASDDVLYSGTGNDTINGGGGFDIMFGGLDDDTYIVDSVDDQVIEAADQGTDSVQASVTYTLAGNVENLTQTGTDNIDGTGNTLDNVLVGNDGNNTLTGLDGNDWLEGGVGTDTLVGGQGNDTYVIQDTNDTVTEALDQGTDLVRSSIEYSLGDNIENLTLTGTGTFDGAGNGLDNIVIGNDSDNTLYGQDGNDILDGAGGTNILLGGNGNDTYVVRALTDYISLWGDEGTDTVKAYTDWSLGGELENLILMGTDDLKAVGNELANVLTGNSGANKLNGAAGADTLFGGAGDDTYAVDNDGDVISEETVDGTDDGGTDVVAAEVSWTLGSHFENLLLKGTANISGIGNTLDNRIRGNSGDNAIDGGAGADTMAGGDGNDTFFVDYTGDWVSELAGEGTDEVDASVSFTLRSEVENLTLLGSADIDGYGNANANELRGNSGANILNGRQGADTMYGGAGNDTYYVDNDNDQIIETVAGDDAGGTDTVIADRSLTLSAFVENLSLIGTADIDATGNALGNILVGTTGKNVLDGDAGADTMRGRDGDDTYYVDNVGDVTMEAADSGTDTIMASISWRLSGNTENLTLTGTDAINATGNGLDNILTGNANNNALFGGMGADTMEGGEGNDTYYVDNAADVVAGETLIGGTDTVMASISYTLGDFVEKLTLIGVDHIDATGNGMNNTVRGNTGDNVLDGGAGGDSVFGGSGADTLIGGTGDDRLSGGLGADIFQFNSVSENGRDRITDFTSGEDHLAFTAADFGWEAGHGLTADELNVTGTAIGNGAQFIYNTTSHLLSWDVNGSDAGGRFDLALLDGVATLTANDFIFG